MSNFRDWKLPKLEKRFNLNRIRLSAMLQAWTEAEEEISDFEKSVLAYFCNHLAENIFVFFNTIFVFSFLASMRAMITYTLIIIPIPFFQ